VLYLAVFNRRCLFNLHDSFNFLSRFPLGRTFFSGFLSAIAPYSASVTPRVEQISVDDKNFVTCVISCEDQPWLHNPYNSIHAIALANIGELSSGVAAFVAMQNTKLVKGIPIQINMEYFKKGRGTMKSTATIDMKLFSASGEVKLESIITDRKNDMIAKCTAVWSLRSIHGKSN
jgi:hypothetical protein